MNKRRILLGAGVVVALLVLAFFLLPHPWSASGRGQRIRIAVNIPLTGPIAEFSGQYANGLTLGIEEGCRELNVPCQNFVLDVQDNAGKPRDAVSILEQQRLRGFEAYISGTSDMSNAISKEIDPVAAPHLLVAFDAFITSKGKNRLRIFPHYKLEGPMYGEYARSRSAKRVFAILLNNSAILEEFSAFVEPELKKQGIAFQREVFDWGFSDFNTLAVKAKAFQPDLVFVNGFSGHILSSIQALRAQGLAGDGNILCAMDFTDLLYNNTPKSEIVGVSFIAPPFEIPGEVGNRDAWVARYKERFKHTPNYVPAFAYDSGRLFVLSYSKRGQVSKEAIQSQLPYTGLTGPITVDADGDLSSSLRLATVAADGRLVPKPAGQASTAK